MTDLQIRFYSDPGKKTINPDLFSSDADKWADEIYKSGCKKDKRTGKIKQENNKASQIRKFYDEILKFYSDIKNEPDDKKRVETYKLLFPYIKMINAKASYAEGRKLTTPLFTSLIKQTTNHLDSDYLPTFEIFKNFFEAFMGFYKFYESKSKFDEED